MTRLFGHGDLRLYLLSLLEDRPRHGYELIRLLEDRFLGTYTPSAGTVYPRLQAMADDGVVAFDEVDGRKVYRLTDAGREELDRRRAEVTTLEERVVESARELARAIREEVHTSVRELKDEVRQAAREMRVERTVERRGMVEEQRRLAREARRARRHGSEEARALRLNLKTELRGFVADVVEAARRHELDAPRAQAARSALLAARSAVLDALAGHGDIDVRIRVQRVADEEGERVEVRIERQGHEGSPDGERSGSSGERPEDDASAGAPTEVISPPTAEGPRDAGATAFLL